MRAGSGGRSGDDGSRPPSEAVGRGTCVASTGGECGAVELSRPRSAVAVRVGVIEGVRLRARDGEVLIGDATVARSACPDRASRERRGGTARKEGLRRRKLDPRPSEEKGPAVAVARDAGLSAARGRRAGPGPLCGKGRGPTSATSRHPAEAVGRGDSRGADGRLLEWLGQAGPDRRSRLAATWPRASLGARTRTFTV